MAEFGNTDRGSRLQSMKGKYGPTQGDGISADMPEYGTPANPNYVVRIQQAGGNAVKAFVPETFQLGVVSSFGQPFGQGLNASAAGKASIMMTGNALTSQSMTAQIWEGTQPIEITLELEFVAESDPLIEVLLPIQRLLEMTMPSRGLGGYLLEPPGPVYKDLINWAAFDKARNALGIDGIASGGGAAAKQIAVQIGNFILFDNVVIEQVNSTFHSLMHESGIPMRATVSVTFKTFFIQLKEDVKDIFLMEKR